MSSKESRLPHVICSLCSEPFSDPRVLACLHSFCFQCLHQRMDKSQQNIQCPICLRGFPIPLEGTYALPKNLHLVFEVEVAGYMSKMTSSCGVPCNFCANGCTDLAVAFCCSCRNFLCTGGVESHNRVPQLSHHNLVALDKESASILPTLLKPMVANCSQCNQANAVVNFFCQTCNLLICPACVIAFHKDHCITELSTITEIHRDKMKKTLQHAQEVALALSVAIDANKMMMMQVEISKYETKLNIEKMFKELLVAAEDRKRALLLELETTSLSVTTSLTIQKEQLEKIKNDVCYYTEATSHILQTHTDHEVVALGGLVPTELEGILKMAENVSLFPSQCCYLTASAQTEFLMNEIQKFGEIVNLSPAANESICLLPSSARDNVKYLVKVVTKTSQGKTYPCGGLRVKAELRPESYDDAPVTSGQVEDCGNGTYNIALIPHMTGLHQLCIMMDDQHVQKSPYNLEVRSYYTSLCSAQQVIDVNCKPLCVAIHENGDIYVGSLDDHIYVFNQSGNLKNAIGCRGSDRGQFKCPSGLSIKGDVMYVADFSNHRIQRLTIGGDFLHAFGEKGSCQGQLKGPRNVVMDSKNRLIVSDKGNNRIQIFTQNGDWLLTIDGNGSSNSNFKDPWGLALDPQWHIHVTAWDSNTIKVFTSEGVYVRMYGTVKGPRGVAVDEDGYSFVSEFNDNSLAIFDPPGNRIHTVWNLNQPYGVAIPNSASLYIPNFGGGDVFKYNL